MNTLPMFIASFMSTAKNCISPKSDFLMAVYSGLQQCFAIILALSSLSRDEFWLRTTVRLLQNRAISVNPAPKLEGTRDMFTMVRFSFTVGPLLWVAWSRLPGPHTTGAAPGSSVISVTACGWHFSSILDKTNYFTFPKSVSKCHCHCLS